MDLIGRREEIKTIKHLLSATESKLLVIYGRRRVGKTFFVRKALHQQIRFEVAGLHRGNLIDQLEHFFSTLLKNGYRSPGHQAPTSWMSAFAMLEAYINTLPTKGKKVIFIDEMPWFDTPRSKFLMAFESFWNSYCTKRPDLLVVICGSAASWMIKKILNNPGGLHNRVSDQISMQPFSLSETSHFLRQKNITWSNYDLAQLYMIMGGIPFYLDAVRKGENVTQFVDRVCFANTGLLQNEHQQLFQSLFNKSERHQLIIAALAKKKKGLERNEIATTTKLSSGGTLTELLNELIESGFVQMVTPFNRKINQSLYRLADPFTLFYFQFMKSRKRAQTNWVPKARSQPYLSWLGLAFERLCFAHQKQILQALQLQAIETTVNNWSITGEPGGAQIDMLIERADRIIHVCEIKFYQTKFTIDKGYAENIRFKLARFGNLALNKNKTLFFTMITPYGVTENKYAKELVQNIVVLEDLMRS